MLLSDQEELRNAPLKEMVEEIYYDQCETDWAEGRDNYKT